MTFIVIEQTSIMMPILRTKSEFYRDSTNCHNEAYVKKRNLSFAAFEETAIKKLMLNRNYEFYRDSTNCHNETYVKHKFLSLS